MSQVDHFLAHNKWGFRQRSDVIHQAVRDFLKANPTTIRDQDEDFPEMVERDPYPTTASE